MVIEGSRCQRLITVNGKPLSREDEEKEELKLKHAVAARHAESKQAREQRIAKYEADRRRDHLLMGQLTAAFDFKLTGQARMAGRSVYLLRATPRSGYQPPNMQAQVLLGMQGQLWIDQQTFQWVKVTARVIRPVSIEGFLAQVEPGTYFELEKMPVSRSVWLPRHFAMKSQTKILYVIGHDTQADETYFDYRPITPHQ